MAKIKSVAKTVQAETVVTVTKGFQAINAPKPTAISVACNAIAAIAATGTKNEKCTPLGHELGKKGGTIDLCILSGKANTMRDFINALHTSGIANVKADFAMFDLATYEAVLAHRVQQHVKWCSNTLNDSHGGFGSRLANVGLQAQRAAIAKHLTELSDQLISAYKAGFAKTYAKRPKQAR